MTTYTYESVLTIVECAQCHMDFGMALFFEKDRRRDHGTFYCPAGHHNFYPQKSTVEKLKAELEDERTRVEMLRKEAQRAREDRKVAQRRVTAMKGVVTKTKKRIAAGKCVRCSHEFPDLAEHMAEVHPEFDPEK